MDQELLLWLGDEPPSVRAADAERIRDIAAEFAMGFDRPAPIGPAVTASGSARTPADHPDYHLMREVGAALGRAGYAVINGRGGGLSRCSRGISMLHPTRLLEWLRTGALAARRIDDEDLATLHVVSDPAEVARIVTATRARQRAEGRPQRRRGA